MEVTNSSQQESFSQKIIEDILSRFSKAGISVEGVYRYGIEGSVEVVDIVMSRPLDEPDFDSMYREFASKGALLFQIKGEKAVIRVVPFKKGKSRWKAPLLGATALTMFATGWGLSSSFYTSYIAIAAWSAVFTALFLAALAVHEYGHMLASKKYGVVIDGPYFIPAPPIQLGFLGTLGAVISMKSLPPSRKSLAQIGVAGPLLGFLAGLAIASIGIALSQPVPLETAQKMVESGAAQPLVVAPVAFYLLSQAATGPGQVLLLHPLAFIGYVVLLVTFFNLIPVGQLDGGHVIRSFVSTAQRYEGVEWLAIGTLFVASVFGTFYLVMALAALLFKLVLARAPHPGPANQFSSTTDKRLLAVYIALLLLCLPLP